MATHIFIIGTDKIPTHLKDESSFSNTLIDNPYIMRSCLQEASGEKIVVAFLPFLEIRHFDMYSYLQKNIPNVKVFFIVSELSESMKGKLKSHREFVVLWKTEECNLTRDILAYLNGKNLELRQDRREGYEKRPLISPSLLPLNTQSRNLQPILGGTFENISLNGSCVKIKAPFYSRKDFVNLTYQTKEGEYVSVEAQVRWTKWNEQEQNQELGVQFLTQA